MLFYLLDILSCFSRRLHEHQAILLCKLLPFLGAHGPSVSEIALVSYQHYCHVHARVLPCILQPARQVVECFPPKRVESSIQSAQHEHLFWYSMIQDIKIGFH